MDHHMNPLRVVPRVETFIALTWDAGGIQDSLRLQWRLGAATRPKARPPPIVVPSYKSVG